MDDTPPEDFLDYNDLKEKYYLLRRMYDEVIESNSQLVLKLEETKWSLARSTNELQEQNNELIKRNLELRRQKNHLSREARRYRSQVSTLKQLVNQALIEVDAQSSSIKRQENCLVDIHAVVSELHYSRSPLSNDEEVESNVMVAPDVLYEIKQTCRPSSGQELGLSPIIEETPQRKTARRTFNSLFHSISVQEVDQVDRKLGFINKSIANPTQHVYSDSHSESPSQIFSQPANVSNEPKSEEQSHSSHRTIVSENNPMLKEDTPNEEPFNLDIVIARKSGEPVRFGRKSSAPNPQALTNLFQNGEQRSSLAFEFDRIANKVLAIEEQSMKSCRQVSVDKNRLILKIPAGSERKEDEKVLIHNVSETVDQYNLPNRSEKKTFLELNESSSTSKSRDVQGVCDETVVINQIYEEPNVCKNGIEDTNQDFEPAKIKISTFDSLAVPAADGVTCPRITNVVPVRQSVPQPKLRPSRKTYVQNDTTPVILETSEESPHQIMTRARSKPRKCAMLDAERKTPNESQMKRAHNTPKITNNSTDGAEDFKVPKKKGRTKKVNKC